MKEPSTGITGALDGHTGPRTGDGGGAGPVQQDRPGAAAPMRKGQGVPPPLCRAQDDRPRELRGPTVGSKDGKLGGSPADMVGLPLPSAAHELRQRILQPLLAETARVARNYFVRSGWIGSRGPRPGRGGRPKGTSGKTYRDKRATSGRKRRVRSKKTGLK